MSTIWTVVIRYLYQVDVLSAQLVLGQVLSVHNPWVLQHLNCCQPLLRVHVEHLGHHILPGFQREGGWCWDGQKMPSRT